MPAVVNMSVGSPCGTSGEGGTSVCPCWTKKSRKARRRSAPVLSEPGGDIQSPGGGRGGQRCPAERNRGCWLVLRLRRAGEHGGERAAVERRLHVADPAVGDLV